MKLYSILFLGLLLQMTQAQAQWEKPSDYVFENILGVCESPEKIIYPIEQDQMQIFTRAVEKAKNENKILVVVFGATWCPWCYSLHKSLPSNKVLESSPYKERFNLVEIAVNTMGQNDKNECDYKKIPSGMAVLKQVVASRGFTTAEQLKEQVTGLPFMAVVDPLDKSKTVLKSTGELEDNTNGPDHSVEKIKEFLNKASCSQGLCLITFD